MPNEPHPRSTGDWRVMRQDDHGHVFVVADNLSEEAAGDLVKEYEIQGHKQTYWAENHKSEGSS